MGNKMISIQMEFETGIITDVTPLFSPEAHDDGPVGEVYLWLKGKKYRILSITEGTQIVTEPGNSCRWVFSGGRYRYV